MGKFKRRKVHPLEKYVGQLVSYGGKKVEVVGYYADRSLGSE